MLRLDWDVQYGYNERLNAGIRTTIAFKEDNPMSEPSVEHLENGRERYGSMDRSTYISIAMESPRKSINKRRIKASVPDMLFGLSILMLVLAFALVMAVGLLLKYTLISLPLMLLVGYLAYKKNKSPIFWLKSYFSLCKKFRL